MELNDILKVAVKGGPISGERKKKKRQTLAERQDSQLDMLSDDPSKDTHLFG